MIFINMFSWDGTKIIVTYGNGVSFTRFPFRNRVKDAVVLQGIFYGLVKHTSFLLYRFNFISQDQAFH